MRNITPRRGAPQQQAPVQELAVQELAVQEVLPREAAPQEAPAQEAAGPGGTGGSAPTGPDGFKKDFWAGESPKFSVPHFRLQKVARLVNKYAGSTPCDLLDVGCGPATFRHLLRPNVHYYGIDIAIVEPGPNLLEADILEAPIRFGDRRFDIVVAQGLFEYLGNSQAQKFAEIAQVLREDGLFIVSYTNFGHRKPHIYEAYSNVQPLERFQYSLLRRFVVHQVFPLSHNWHHGQPTRAPARALNMHVDANIPVISPWLAVEYLFVCTAR